MDAFQEPVEAIYALGFSRTVQRELVVEFTKQFPAVEVTNVDDLDVWHLRVPRDQFEGSEAEANLADAAWLTPRVLAHQAALEVFAKHLPFFPLSFGTLFSSMAALYDTVRLNHRGIIDFLELSQGKSEWGLKCFVHWDAAHDQAHPATTGQPTSASGSDYLRRKKAIRQRDETLRQVAEQHLQQTVDKAQALSTQWRIRRVVVGQNANQQCVRNLALLVDNDSLDGLQQWVAEVNASTSTSCIRFELTGPWPLYSFAPSLASPAETADRAEDESTSLAN